MILKEFMIRRYGPLPDSGLIKPGPFNLFYGPNEEGKTLTIDALLRMLMGKGVKLIKGVNRVEENPEGHLILEDSPGQEFKLPEAGTLENLFNLNPTEFANIFVIRDSDLVISDESLFYRDITNRLTGLRTGEIEKLKKNICDLGGITVTGDYQNTMPVKLKDRIKKAGNLLERAGQLLDILREEGFSRFEEELAELEAGSAAAAEELALLRSARYRELYEKGSHALGSLQAARSELNKLKDFNREGFEAWQRAESALEHISEDLRRLEEEIGGQKEVLRKSRDSLNESRRAFEKARRQVQAASETIVPKLDLYDREEPFLRAREAQVNTAFYNRAAAVSTLAMVLSLFALVFRAHWWPVPFLLFFTGLTAFLAWNKYFCLRKKGHLAAIETGVCSEAEKLNLPADNIGSVRSALSRLKAQHSEREELYIDAEREYEWQLKEEKRLREERDAEQWRFKESGEQVRSFQRKSGLENLGLYADLLDRKDRLKGEVEKQSSILGSHFGESEDLHSERARTLFWQDRVSELQGFADAARDIKYDQKAGADLAEKRERLERQKKELVEKMRERSAWLRDIEKEANELLQPSGEDLLTCQTTVDLEVVQHKLDKWLRDQESNRAAALAAMEILGQIEEEEEKKVTALFGPENQVSSYFSRVTGGSYRKVTFESRENMIRVTRPDGSAIEAFRLSGGTYDQLYFSIRMALGKKILGGGRGFFILDDPFIKADPARLKMLLEMLNAMAAGGWQILYFSAKGEIKAALQKKIDRGEVREFSVS